MERNGGWLLYVGWVGGHIGGAQRNTQQGVATSTTTTTHHHPSSPTPITHHHCPPLISIHTHDPSTEAMAVDRAGGYIVRLL